MAHIRIAARLADDGLEETSPDGARVRYRPLGTVALITPWNNPLAIAAGKLAPALACGNGCVWKPSPLAPDCSARLLQSLRDAGLPDGLVVSIHGDADTVRAVVADGRIDGVSVTGSSATGQAIAACCAARGIPLQAELGGNNAAIILDGLGPSTRPSCTGWPGACSALPASAAPRFAGSSSSAAPWSASPRPSPPPCGR